MVFIISKMIFFKEVIIFMTNLNKYSP